jgi:hypothetical protein
VIVGGSEAIGMASVTMGRLADDDGELVQTFLDGTEKEASKDSLKSLPVNTMLSGMDDSGELWN